MTSVQRDATAATAVFGLLAAATLLAGLMGALPSSLSSGATRWWWIATGGLCAMACVGMVLRRAAGWYMAFAALVSLAGVSFTQLVGGRVYGFVTLAVAGFAAWELARASSWFPGAGHQRSRDGRGGFGGPLDAPLDARS